MFPGARSNISRLDRSTTLLGADGRIYNVADAPIDITYVGFADDYTVTSGKWGTTTIVATPRPVLQGYVEDNPPEQSP